MLISQLLTPISMVLALSHAARAMNLTFTGKDCSNNTNKIYSKIPYFNATSTTKFHVQPLNPDDDQPWYYSLTLSDERSGTLPWITRWLSVPKSLLESDNSDPDMLTTMNTFCMYTREGYEKTVKNTEGNNTCAGVVENKCMKEFRDLEEVPYEGCPRVDLSKDCVTDGGLVSTSKSITLNKDTCHVASVPGLDDIPKDYISIEVLTVGYTEDKEYTVYDEYDKALRQPIASHFVLGASSYRKQMTVSVCAAPDNIKRDSRTLEAGKKDDAPEYKNDDDDDGDSLGVRLGVGKAAGIALGVACLVSATLL